MPAALYDEIGVGYSRYRRPDPRIGRYIHDALASAHTVVNVGAGTGAYEPANRRVIAVEPSAEMVRQRSSANAPAVRAVAEYLPFADHSFDAALAILTLHHWPDWQKGLAELQRIAHGPVVLLTWDPESEGFWLVQEYFPEIVEIDRQIFPTIPSIAAALGPVEVQPVLIPADCSDGFLGAYWRRPAAYLDAGVRGAISSFARLPRVEHGLASLASDIEDGSWSRRHGALLNLSELDLGYRIITARRVGPAV